MIWGIPAWFLNIAVIKGWALGTTEELPQGASIVEYRFSPIAYCVMERIWDCISTRVTLFNNLNKNGHPDFK